MARTVNEEEYAEKRNEILNAVQRLVYTKGYLQMTIQDILDDLKISKGAFYHYFDSKPALLEALSERMMDEAEKLAVPIVNDPHLTALEKFQQFFSALIRWKTAQQAFVVALLRVWFSDDNAIVRHKVNGLMVRRMGPLFTAIVRQGIREKVFSTAYPDQAGEVIIAILVELQSSIGRLLFEPAPADDPRQRSHRMVALYDVYLDALERVLGAPGGSLYRLDTQTAEIWITALDEANAQTESADRR